MKEIRMKPSELLRKAAEGMSIPDPYGMGCCFALAYTARRIHNEFYRGAAEYLNLFRPEVDRGFWFGSTEHDLLYDKRVSRKEVLKNKHTRVICLLLASAIAESEGN